MRPTRSLASAIGDRWVCADAGQPLFGALTLAPLAQVFKDGGTKTPTADEVVLVFTPLVAQHLFGDPVGPGGQSCDGFNQPLLLEFPSLEPPRARMNATREHHVRLTKRLATTGLHTNRVDACRYGSQDHTGESFHALHVDTWIGGAGIRSAGPERDHLTNQ